MSNYLQLADPGQLSNAQFLSEYDVGEFYIRVPTDDGGFVRIREDYFDQYSPQEYAEVMNYLEQFQDDREVSGLFSGWADRKAQRKADRDVRRDEKRDYKLQKQAQRSTTLQNIVGGITDAAKGIFGKGDSEMMPMQQKDFQFGGGIDFGVEQQAAQQAQNKKMLLIGLGALVIVGGVVYFTRKKRK